MRPLRDGPMNDIDHDNHDRRITCEANTVCEQLCSVNGWSNVCVKTQSLYLSVSVSAKN